MKKQIVIQCMIFVMTLNVVAMVNAEERARTDRYTLVSMEAKSDQSRPLSTITNISLGREIGSVGDAINELLKGSGYRWQSQDGIDHLLNELPLPEVVRNLGPIRLSDALQTLAGETWTLRTDNLNRIVWFEKSVSEVKPINFKE